MKTVKVVMSDEAYRRLVHKRREAGLPSIAAYFLNEVDELTDDDAAREIVTIALQRAPKQVEDFTLKGLFDVDLWGQFTKGARLRAGRLFYERVSAATDGIAIGGKTSSGHQLYRVRRPTRRRAA